MTTKAQQAAAERKVMDRYEARLTAAYVDRAISFTGRHPAEGWAEVEAEHVLAILKASASALFPGRQKRKHVLPALGKMVTAACRVIRGGAS